MDLQSRPYITQYSTVIFSFLSIPSFTANHKTAKPSHLPLGAHGLATCLCITAAGSGVASNHGLKVKDFEFRVQGLGNPKP